LARRSLRYYRGANLAVVAGVGIAVSVLAGALLVGESVRSSLRRLVLERLGNTVSVAESAHPFHDGLLDGAPILALEGIVTAQSSGRRATGVLVYGVDERFWKFHGVAPPEMTARQAAASPALVEELAAKEGDPLLVRIDRPSAIPEDSLHGRKEDPADSMALRLKTVLPAARMGEFSLRPQQGAVKALFVPLAAAGNANLILSTQPAASVERLLRERFRLEDLGLKLAGNHLHHSSGMLTDAVAAAARKAAQAEGVRATETITYLANTTRIGAKEIPYSLVAAVDLRELPVTLPAALPENAIVLNRWAAADLGAKPGDRVEIEYYLWHSDGRLTTEKAEFVLAGIVPIEGLAADRNLSPEYPGLTDAESVSDWDPPFPLKVDRVRPKDEDYWDTYRTTPKAFVSLEKGQQLWASRWGKLTSIRFPADPGPGFARRLRSELDPLANGFRVSDVRASSLNASRGATDFGEYFVYFSFFLMVSALLLAGLFFRLSIEQRSSQVGLLRAVGFPPGQVRRQFLTEGAMLAAAGGALGVAGAAAYAGVVLLGLGTWWVDAVGTRELALHLPPVWLATGVIGGILAAFAAIAWTLRGLARLTPRVLLAGGKGDDDLSSAFRTRATGAAIVAMAAAGALLGATAVKAIPPAGGFFGAGTLTLIAGLAALRALLASSRRLSIRGLGPFAIRNAVHRPGRTVLSSALIASATFLIVSVEAFRRDPGAEVHDRKSGTGGFALMGESMRPLYHDPNTTGGRDALNLDSLDRAVQFTSLRLRPGDDASCLNLYQPRNPRILGAPASFLRQERFAFASSEGDAANPWLLLEEERTDGAIPAIADANSMAYVLHKKLGEEIEVTGSKGDTVRLRLVASLSDSVLQGEVVIGERHFLRAFSDIQGYRMFLIDAPAAIAGTATEEIESALTDHGMDVVSTGAKLAAFHRVENTYLSTFQTLGALGLLLGTAGLAAILFRNVLERSREMALLSAVGYENSHLARLVLGENLLLLLWGLASGVAAAAIAIAPVIASRGAHFSWSGMASLLFAVIAVGFLASFVATRLALRATPAAALRAL
jgi:ABC-type lipoprotein release transport system permease subunit